MIWAKLTAELVGKPYRAGAAGLDAYDCMGLIIRTQRKMGWKMPAQFEGWSLENYAARFEADPEQGLAVLERLLDAHCRRIDPHFLKRGDVIIVKIGESGQRVPAVYAGKRQFLTVVKDRKVRIYGADRHFTIERGWRYGHS